MVILVTLATHTVVLIIRQDKACKTLNIGPRIYKCSINHRNDCRSFLLLLNLAKPIGKLTLVSIKKKKGKSWSSKCLKIFHMKGRLVGGVEGGLWSLGREDITDGPSGTSQGVTSKVPASYPRDASSMKTRCC
jgi:hypothetical protein